jgi:hypothetical protein
VKSCTQPPATLEWTVGLKLGWRNALARAESLADGWQETIVIHTTAAASLRAFWSSRAIDTASIASALKLQR